jgi:hypothetical protein
MIAKIALLAHGNWHVFILASAYGLALFAQWNTNLIVFDS